MVSIKRNTNECNTGTASSINKIQVFNKVGNPVKEFPYNNETSDFINLNLYGIKNDFYVITIQSNGTVESYPVAIFN